MPATDRKLRVFLCHAPPDKPIVRDLYQRLFGEGWIDPWLDEENLLPGQEWGLEIDKALELADMAVICLSRQSLVTDSYIHRELKAVIDIARDKPENSMFIVPIRLDDCDVPRSLRTWHYVDFSSIDTREDAYKRLMKSLRYKYELVTGQTDQSQTAHYVSRSPKQKFDDLENSTFGGFNFAKIPAGKFIMGSKVSNDLAAEDEIPQRPYTIPYDCWVNRYPISNEQFGEYAISEKRADLLPDGWRKKLSQPIVNISWYDAVAYIKWLNKVFNKEITGGLVFRLPTEAEWERASRGDFGREWPWGNEKLDLLLNRERPDFFGDSKKKDRLEEYMYSDDFADYFAEAFGLNPSEVGNGPEKLTLEMVKMRVGELRRSMELADVGTFSPITDSSYKIADMMGSVWEWTQSLYLPYPYDVTDGRENLEASGERVIRGSFMSRSERFTVRSAKRGCALPDRKEPYLGFRIVVGPQVS